MSHTSAIGSSFARRQARRHSTGATHSDLCPLSRLSTEEKSRSVSRAALYACGSSTLTGDDWASAPGAYLQAEPISGTAANRTARDTVTGRTRWLSQHHKRLRIYRKRSARANAGLRTYSQ